MSDHDARPDRIDPAGLAGLAADLAGFTVDAVTDLLDERSIAALDRENVLPARLRLRERDEPLAVLVRLLLLGETVAEEHVRTALPSSYEAAAAAGLLVVEHGSVRAAVDLRPTRLGEEDLLLASDPSEAATGRGVRPDHVLGLGGASATLARLTIRRPVSRALDLGTGSGIQALGLSAHADRVVATDVSRRALDLAAFNRDLDREVRRVRSERRVEPSAQVARVAGPAQIELRYGSLWEPVAGEVFDLIASNPPFVISPRGGALATYTYRDGGRSGDDLLAGLVADLPRMLAPGGIAQLLGNWEVRAGEPWQTRVEGWARGTGLDAWVIQRELLDPAQYVETWLRDGGLTPDRDGAAWDEAYEQWLADLDSRQVAGVGFGYLVFRNQGARPPWVRLEEITGTIAPVLGETIATVLDVVDTLERTDDAALADWHVRVAPDVTEERHYRPGEADPQVIVLRQGGGFARTVRADTVLAAVVGACDGELSLGRIAAAVAALLDVDPGALWAQVARPVRGLLTDGLLLAPSDAAGALP
ncbi:SAM-dependent methyltransferase [Pseudactinotalea sp. HY158]|uniref:DUF7059 domain-containing protein n=1 Tax=Pseudactinotalea sp. HY158 TaxID=2654547 RepID=UPI00129C8A71|nr:SAM-dependent methyltransferase [Pseudactinotalea sp. HY158]QGH68384.1 SAM-dependent methyltransferase [Pseudactinotalea sp. HY158]